MTPLEQKELEVCLRRVSEILYNNSDTESLENLEEVRNYCQNQGLRRR